MSLYNAFLKKLAHFQTEHPFLTILLVLSLTLAMYSGVSKVRTVASLEQMMPQTIEEIEAFNVLRDNNLGQDMIAVVIQLNRESTDPNGVYDIRDKRVYDYIVKLNRLLNSEVDVRQTYSIVSPIQFLTHKEDLTDEEYQNILLDDRMKSSISNYYNSDFSKTLIIISTDVSADDSRMNLLATRIIKDINSIGHPSGLELKFTGTPIVQRKLGELINADRSSTQWISTLFVFIIIVMLFGTFTSALVPLIIVTISINWLYGTMGYNNLPISTLAGGVAAMVVGIGIDYALHLMNKFKLERKKGLSIKKSIEAAVLETGTALTVTSLTTMVAFIAFLVGDMPEMGRFGILMAMGVLYSLIFSLAALPAFLVLEEKLIIKLKSKMKFGVEGEFVLVNKHTLKKKPKGYVKVNVKDLDDLSDIYVHEDKLSKIKKNKIGAKK